VAFSSTAATVRRFNYFDHRCRAFEPEQAESLRELLHHEPRKFVKGTSLWTPDLDAEVSFDDGLTESRVTGETVRARSAF
jgi:hypothetical protein